MNKIRKDGYYWVKLNGAYIIAEWVNYTISSCWYVCGREEGFNDNEFDSINETPISPEVYNKFSK